MSVKPTFFIVGTPKGGTTSLFNYLEEHPEVFVPKIKEPHFFSCPEVKNTYYNATIIDSLEAYQKLYKESKTYKAIGDFSSSYLNNENSPKKIKDFNPQAKVVIVLRNPVERAISHYLMDYSLGYISVPLKEIINNKQQYADFYEQYVETGFYDGQLKNYLQVFKPSNIQIILSDDLFSETEKTVSNLFQFIGVDTSFKPDYTKKHNQFKQARFPVVKKLRQSKTLQIMMGNTPAPIKSLLGKLVFNNKKGKPQLLEETAILKSIYKPHILVTQTLIDKDLNKWF